MFHAAGNALHVLSVLNWKLLPAFILKLYKCYINISLPKKDHNRMRVPQRLFLPPQTPINI